MQKLNQAVPQRAAIIKDAKTMYDLLVENFSHPAASSFNACMKSVQLNWHVFFHVLVTGEGAVQQNRPGCHFKTLKGIRKLLCVKSLPQQEKLLVRFHELPHGWPCSPEVLAASVFTSYSQLKCQLLLLDKTTENDSLFRKIISSVTWICASKTVSENVIFSEGNNKQ